MPLEATTLVVADERSTVAIVTLDLAGLTVAQARGLRTAVASAIGTDPDSVLINVSHTHGAPHTAMGAGHKLGGELRTVHDREKAYVDLLFHQIVGSAVQARARLEPARVGSGTGTGGSGPPARRAPLVWCGRSSAGTRTVSATRMSGSCEWTDRMGRHYRSL